MKHFAFLVVLPALLISCTPRHQVSAYIEGLENDTLFVDYISPAHLDHAEETHHTTLTAAHNRFVFDTPEKDPILLFIFPKKGSFQRMSGSYYYPKQKYLTLLIKPQEHIRVKGKLHPHYLEYTAAGSDFNADYSQLRNGYIRALSRTVQIELQLDSCLARSEDKETTNRLFDERNTIEDAAHAAELQYIKQHGDKELAAYLLTLQSLDTLDKYDDVLSPDIRNGLFKQMLDSRHVDLQRQKMTEAAKKNIAVGKKAPDFSLPSLSGTECSLYGIDSKITVLEFWGSWCGWCIKGLPKMKEYYKKYGSKMEIVGIDCYDTEKAWRDAVEEAHLDWLQLYNSTELSKDVSVLYGVRGFPTKIVLDRDKTILGIYEGEDPAFYRKLDAIMSRPF